MTQAVAQTRNSVARSGFTNPLTLAVLVKDETEVEVYADGAQLTNGPDYVITGGVGDPDGVEIEIIGADDADNWLGVVTFTAIYRPLLDQLGDLSAGGVLGRAYEAALDDQNRRLQSVADIASRALAVPEGAIGDFTLPLAVPYAALVWNADGDGFLALPLDIGDSGIGTIVGPGVPAGGASGQYLRKASGTDYVTEWHTLAASEIVVTPTGALAASDVQAALAELDTDLTTEVDARVAAIAGEVTLRNAAIAAYAQPVDTDLTTVAAQGMSLFSGLLFGCTLSNNAADGTNDIDFAAGLTIDNTTFGLIACAAMTKRLDASWSAGTGNGMRYSGAAITDTTYHLWAVATAAGVQDYYADPSATRATVLGHLQAETGGSAYVSARRIGSIIRASSAIVAFRQNGDYFWRAAPVRDLNAASIGTTRQTRTLSIPTGVQFTALVRHAIFDDSPAADSFAILTDLAGTDVAPSASINDVWGHNNSTKDWDSSFRQVMTNTSAQIGSRINATDADLNEYIWTFGWIDNRGRAA